MLQVDVGNVRFIVISNKNGKLFLLNLSYSEKYLSQSKLIMTITINHNAFLNQDLHRATISRRF